MVSHPVPEIITPMKLLITSFVSGVYSMIIYATISQTDFLAWSATFTTAISAVSLGVMHVWRSWKQMTREEEEKDRDICQGKLDEAIARIRALDSSINELKDQANDLKDQADRWQEIAKSQGAKLSTVVNEVKQINSGLKNE